MRCGGQRLNPNLTQGENMRELKQPGVRIKIWPIAGRKPERQTPASQHPQQVGGARRSCR